MEVLIYTSRPILTAQWTGYWTEHILQQYGFRTLSYGNISEDQDSDLATHNISDTFQIIMGREIGHQLGTGIIWWHILDTGQPIDNWYPATADKLEHGQVGSICPAKKKAPKVLLFPIISPFGCKVSQYLLSFALFSANWSETKWFRLVCASKILTQREFSEKFWNLVAVFVGLVELALFRAC